MYNLIVTLYNGSDLIIIKTDGIGDTLWTRTHGNFYTNDGGDDISQTSDGGYIVTGYSNSAQFTAGGYYILKTDSFGMTSSHCQEFNTSIATGNVVPWDSSITITITKGIINSINSNVPHMTDTVEQKNGCYLSAVGIDEQLGKSDLEYQAVPNPSAGLFTLKNNTANTGSNTIIVYDIFGHEIFTLQHSVATATQLDLTTRSPGFYFIKIIQGDKVEMVKVVVE
jgi:hypothetical protein